MVFAINRENANQMFISVPVFSSVRKYVGEVITPILFENIYTIDDALKIMTSNFEAHPKFKLGDSYYKHFFRARKSLTSNVSVDSIVEFLQENFMIEENDRIFYVTHSDRLTDSFDDVCLVLESADGDVVVESVFQPRENQSPSFFSKLFSFFKKNRVTEPDRPYARLPEID
jgi:hypothetical protein